MTPEPDLTQWIGRTTSRSDVLSDRLCDGFVAVLAPHLASTLAGAVALGIHWCLAPSIVEHDALGFDGHPGKGGFLPPVPLPRRMWAGVETVFLRPLQRGETVTRESKIENVVQKSGRSGELCFVTVAETYVTSAGPAIVERLSIVYRGSAAALQQQEAPSAARDPEQTTAVLGRWVEGVDAIRLFRYSALTFNAHRIHYDRDYARKVESYPDLLVHGPLQATLLLNALAAEEPPRNFRCRALAPLFAEEAFAIELDGASRIGSLRKTGGEVTMTATVE